MMVDDQVAELEPDQAPEQDRIPDFPKVEVLEWAQCKWEEFLQEWHLARRQWEAQWVASANSKTLLVVADLALAHLLEIIPSSNMTGNSPITEEVANLICPVATILKWTSNKWDTAVVHLALPTTMLLALLELDCSSQISKTQKKSTISCIKELSSPVLLRVLDKL
jgi:hypothetical protein